MKSTIIGIVVSVTMIATFAIIGTLVINNNVKDEMEYSMNNAMSSTQRVIFDKRKEIKSNEEYLQEFNADLRKQLNETEDVSYSIDIYGVDYKKGLLDVKVTAKYKNLYGQPRQVASRKTMIIDEIPN